MMFAFLLPLIIFWFLRSVKYILFWVYLWQLKQYHRARFIDYFKTDKGKKTLLQPLQLGKVLVLLACFMAPSVYLVVIFQIMFLAYFLETILFIKSFYGKRVKYPRLTLKTILLLGISLLIIIGYPFIFQGVTLKWSLITLLAFDILLPVIISAIVLAIQPIADYHRISLQKKAKEKMAYFKNLKVIGITGSYGKTSTKDYLTTILSSRFNVLSAKNHQNTEVAIPKIILNELKPEHQILIIEMAAYDKGTIKKICEFAKPKIGVVTGVNEQHLSVFGSMENLLSAEGGRELAKYLESDGLIVLNGDNKHCLDLYRQLKGKRKIYSIHNKEISPDVFADNLDVRMAYSSFVANQKNGKKEEFKVELKGEHNISNILACILVAEELGMSLKEISEVARKITAEKDPIKLLKTGKGITVLDSTYSANPDGVIADLNYLSIYPSKKVVVMPCLIELGSKSKEAHEKIGEKLALVADLTIVTTKEYYEDIKKGAKDALLIPETNLVIDKLNSFCKKGDVVLFEGRVSADLVDKFIANG